MWCIFFCIMKINIMFVDVTQFFFFKKWISCFMLRQLDLLPVSSLMLRSWLLYRRSSTGSLHYRYNNKHNENLLTYYCFFLLNMTSQFTWIILCFFLFRQETIMSVSTMCPWWRLYCCIVVYQKMSTRRPSSCCLRIL